MAKLVKVQISGIRSFGPLEEDVQQIKFCSPLTLFLGQNGCGKTTIIEAIRHAFTGDFPANSTNGQGFVNDPKLSGKATTKGQIKLKLTDTKGNDVTIVRVMEVSLKPQGMKFSSKPACLKIMKPNGEEDSISGRCGDITEHCCQIINVSPSVLNNVIFCHQENSSWPLEEGKKLKEKFDEIFDAQKYNKCTEVFRKTLKDKQAQLKVLKIELSYRKERKEIVDKDKRKLEEKEEKLNSLVESAAQKEDVLTPINIRIGEICELENVLVELQRQLATKEETKKGMIEQQNTIRRNASFKEFTGSDEELESKIRSFQNDRQKDDDIIAVLENRKTDIENKGKTVANALQDCQSQIGKFNQEKEQYQTRSAEKKDLVQKAKARMNVTSFTDCDLPENGHVILNELKSALEVSQMSLESIIEEKEEEEMSLQKDIDENREKQASAKQQIESKKSEIKDCEKKIFELTEELKNISTADDLLENASKKLEEIDSTIFNLKSGFKEEEEKKKIDECRREIRNKESALEELESDFRILQQNDVIEGKLETEKHSIRDKEQQISKIKNKHSDSLMHLFGNYVPDNGYKNALDALQKKDDAAVKDLTNQINQKQKEVTTLEAKKSGQLERIRNCENELKEKENKISEACNGRNFNQVLDEVYQKKEELQRDRGQYSSAKIIYEKFLQEFEKDTPCCPVCMTNFGNKKNAIKEIVSTIRSKIEKVPRQLANVEAELVKEEATYNKLQQLKGVNDDIEILNNVKLPLMKEELEEISSNFNTNSRELEAMKIKMQVPQKNVEICRSIISDIASLDQNQLYVEKSQRTIEYLKEQLVTVSSNKSKQEIEAEIDTVKADLSDLRRRVDVQQKKVNNHNERLQKILNDRAVTLSNKMKLQAATQNKPLLERQTVEMTDKIESLKAEIAKHESGFNIIESALINAIEKKQTAVQRNKERVSLERNKVNSNKKMIDDIERIQVELDIYVKNEIEAKLASTELQLSELKTKVEDLERTREKLINAISSKIEERATHDLRYRVLEENKVLREKKRLETSLLSEITQLKRRIGDYNYRSVHDEKVRLTARSEALQKEIDGIEGQKSELIVVIDELKQELEKPDNKQAYKQYMSKYYELNLLEIIILDINKYVVALEKSILKFHKARMGAINKTIREYWRNTYRGNDIDYIEIKTEHATGHAARRSYNYKVVQVKKGVELDMRGRCSAGQKVLACLIIRLAIAETLSANCGILALDEPTTNLDQENILSLSDTIARIVNHRQNEKNFQLLVITHDEAFLNTLTRAQNVPVPYFYRVSRNDNGFSEVKKEYNF